MKVVILAGGLGTRLSEETDLKPKPMVEIGQKPILWHIMKLYSHYGFNDFVLCLGYKGYMVKEYFTNYYLHQSDLTVDLKNNSLEIHQSNAEPWKITMVDTGLHTMTGGRIKRIEKYVDNKPFMLTYGDGVGNINIKKLIKLHESRKRLATLTSVQPSAKFGVLDMGEKNFVKSFTEKPKGDGSWVNAGFFVLEPGIFKYLGGDAAIWEGKPIEAIAAEKQLSAYQHEGFWKCMDTVRDKLELENLWQSGKAPWKVWK